MPRAGGVAVRARAPRRDFFDPTNYSRVHVKASIERLAQEFEDLAHRDARLPLADKDGCTALFAFRQWEFSEFTRLRRR